MKQWTAKDSRGNGIITVVAETKDKATDLIRKELRKNAGRMPYYNAWDHAGFKVEEESTKERLTMVTSNLEGIEEYATVEFTEVTDRALWDTAAKAANKFREERGDTRLVHVVFITKATDLTLWSSWL